VYQAYFQAQSVYDWRELSRYYSDFINAVKIEKKDRYKLIDENKPSELNEEQARELAQKAFKRGIKESDLPNDARTTTLAHKKGKQASREILRAHNWEWDKTEIAGIEFDEQVIKEMEKELP